MIGMHISFIPQAELLDEVSRRGAKTLDFILLITGAMREEGGFCFERLLDESVRLLRNGGLLFVQGLPEILPRLGVYLDQHLTFKYWLAVESEMVQKPGLPSVHAGVLLFAKGNERLNLKRIRLPHQYCKACQRTLKDWGGKTHLMHPEGYVISDVIQDLPKANNYTQISKPLFDLLVSLIDVPTANEEQPAHLFRMQPHPIHGLVAPIEGVPWKHSSVCEPSRQYVLPGFSHPMRSEDALTAEYEDLPLTNDDTLFNIVHQGDALEILKRYPDKSIDLAFADPPYNLDKSYTVYDDERSNAQYIEWCNQWLMEYVRILKPTGSLFVLNLPHWALYHANFLNQHLYFQNWIVWDALSEPRGKIMPAHYALLFYTKSARNFTFNYQEVSPIDARYYCLRSSCIRQRKRENNNDQSALTDIWWDIHRIKHRRDRDYHPCQLPESLVDRIIKMCTKPGDIVLDAFCGTGTTPIAALRLGRRYVAIDLDPYYVKMTQDKITALKENGEIVRRSIRREPRKITKKALQLELRQLALKLGRLPTPEDVKAMSQYDIELYLENFATWGKALKAAKLEIENR